MRFQSPCLFLLGALIKTSLQSQIKTGDGVQAADSISSPNSTPQPSGYVEILTSTEPDQVGLLAYVDAANDHNEGPPNYKGLGPPIQFTSNATLATEMQFVQSLQLVIVGDYKTEYEYLWRVRLDNGTPATDFVFLVPYFGGGNTLDVTEPVQGVGSFDISAVYNDGQNQSAATVPQLCYSPEGVALNDPSNPVLLLAPYLYDGCSSISLAVKELV